MSPSPATNVRMDLAREELRWRRDARYRTNIAFAIKQLRAVAVLVILVGSLVFGWPVPNATLAHLTTLHLGWPSL